MNVDALIIGGGIAGASVGYRLAEHGSVLVLEMEREAGYHSTGRSAAQFTMLYGNRVIRSLARLSKGFMAEPSADFSEAPILAPRGVLFVADESQRDALDAIAGLSDAQKTAPMLLSTEEALRLVPVLRPEAVATALHEADSKEIDVHALHEGFLRGLRHRGGEIALDAEVQSLRRPEGKGQSWRIETADESYEAPVVINAAGAWADEIAKMADLEPVGLTPKRRTVILFDPPADTPIEDWPLVIAADESWYFKPEAGRLMASPADETPTLPCDAQAEEIDMAQAAHRIETATHMAIGRILHRRAGLRIFAVDKTPVVGFAPETEGFFWLAGQGGYGIKTSPAMSEMAASLIVNGSLPAHFTAEGLDARDFAPDRFAT